MLCYIMLDGSIISSQPKSNEPLSETQIKRKNDHQSVEQNRGHELNNEIFHNLVNEFYKDSEDEELDSTSLMSTQSAVIKNFKPFEFEKSFAMADRLLPQEKKQNILSQTQGFVTCTALNKSNLNTVYSENINEENNSSYVITESELISCCHQVEKILENSTLQNKNNVKIKNELTPDKSDSMVLVNSILEDFSQSPLKKEQIQNTSWQYTPEFRMRRRPVKNYSRKFLKSTKANLNQLFEEHIRRDSSECNDSHSCCSSLSIQEDVTLNENIQYNSVVTTGNTQRICENLLNLSEYYTQNQAEQDISDRQQVCFPTSSQENDSFLKNTRDLLNDILTLRSIYPNKIRYDSYDSLDDFRGFWCEEYALDNNSTEHLIMEGKPTNEIKVCNSRQSNVLNDGKNVLDDWNEEDYLDEWGSINTESVLQQQDIRTKSTEITKSFKMSKTLEEKIGSTNYAGFKTASSKPIKVSREAHIMAAKILSILPEIPEFEQNTSQNNCDKKIANADENVFENPEDYEWNDDCDFFLNFKTPITCKEETENLFLKQLQLKNHKLEQITPNTSKSVTLGYKTAGGKNVHISNTAQMTVEKLLKEFTYDLENGSNCEEELRKMKCKAFAKNHNLETAQSTLSNIEELSTHHEVQITEGTNLKMSIINPENLKNRTNEEDFEKEGESFKVTSNQNVNVMESAQNDPKSAKNLLANFNKNRKDDNLSDLISLTKDVNERNHKYKGADGHNVTFGENIENPLKTTSKEQLQFFQMSDKEGQLLNNDIGFQTANGKNVFISTKSKQAVQNLFQDLDIISNVSDCERDIMELKMKIENKRKDLDSKSVEGTNEHNKMTLNESSRTKKDKRRKSIDDSDLDSNIRTPPIKKLKNDLHASKSSFAEQTLKSPLSSAKHSLILRKNLSLTKKRKSRRISLSVSTKEIPKINTNVYDLGMDGATPVKSNTSLTVSAKTPATPNLNEFFSNPPLTSTPQVNNSRKLIQIIEDPDLKPITWNNTNDDSIGLSGSSPVNTNLNSSNPTVKERIDRLRMYGKAPAVSPILIETNKNCRPSGLRRSRSMIKKIKNDI